MSRSFAEKLWNASPASLMRAARRRLRPKHPPGWFDVRGGPLKGAHILLPDTNGAWGEMIAGTFDSFIYEDISRTGGIRDKVVWDVGAHFGFHTLSFAQLGAKVVAFEPNSANRAVLHKNLEHNPGLAKAVQTFPIAISNEDGETTFMANNSIDGSSSGSHLAAADSPYAGGNDLVFEKETVKTARGDTLCRNQGVPPPDLMKIDVEGAEALVLEGACEILGTKKPRLYIEVHHICAMSDLRGLLDRFRYNVTIVDRENATPSRCFVVAF